MSKKKGKGSLYLIFAVLLIAVIITQISKSRKGERSFKSDLMEFAAEDVASIDLYTKANNFKPFSILNNNGEWTIKQDEKEYPADSDLINNMIHELSGLQAIQKVAAKKDRWDEFDVTDTTGVRVVVNSNKKVIGDVFIGRFSYNQNTRKPKTFVRLNKDNDVYAVEGYLSMTFNRDISGLRNKSVFRGNRNDITRINVTYPADSSFTLIKEDSTGWMIDGMPVDSTNISNYLGSISYLTGSEFRDDIDPVSMASSPYTVVIEGKNMSSVEIKGMLDPEGKSLVLSSANKSTVFDGRSGDLFNKIFVAPDHFRPGGNK